MVLNVKIVSEKGRSCTFENPWPGKTPLITVDGKKIPSSVNGNEYTFQTEPDKQYTLTLN
jgi:hypothetical protein